MRELRKTQKKAEKDAAKQPKLSGEMETTTRKTRHTQI